jgi:hypothetical protein
MASETMTPQKVLGTFIDNVRCGTRTRGFPDATSGCSIHDGTHDVSCDYIPA